MNTIAVAGNNPRQGYLDSEIEQILFRIPGNYIDEFPDPVDYFTTQRLVCLLLHPGNHLNGGFTGEAYNYGTLCLAGQADNPRNLKHIFWVFFEIRLLRSYFNIDKIVE